MPVLLLIAIGLLAGLIAGVSPCVLPVLPVIFFAGGASGADRADTAVAGGASAIRATSSVRRPLMIILGLIVSFSAFTLLGSALLTALDLPQDALRWAGLVVLTLVGLGLIFAPVQDIVARPFRRLPALFGRQALARGTSGRGSAGAFVLGLGLGALYVPCAGPVLAAISIAGATRHFTGGIGVLTVAFSVGVAVPLFFFGLAGSRISVRLSAYRRRSSSFRIAGGLVMVMLAVALTFNLTDRLQRAIPGYTQALQDRVENNAPARTALASLAGNQVAAAAGNTVETSAPPASRPSSPPTRTTASPVVAAVATGPVVACKSHATSLANCGVAAPFVGLESWMNTPGNRPVSLTALRGKVVLVNFWTFSCINCQRALPAIKSWYADYRSSGLVVIGVHTPEFAYEHTLSNVQDAVSSDGITYPVALDNSSATWRSFNNAYWPAEYLIDAQGVLRHVVFGEGGYADSETLIRALLRAANPTVNLPAPTDPAVPVG